MRKRPFVRSLRNTDKTMSRFWRLSVVLGTLNRSRLRSQPCSRRWRSVRYYPTPIFFLGSLRMRLVKKRIKRFSLRKRQMLRNSSGLSSSMVETYSVLLTNLVDKRQRTHRSANVCITWRSRWRGSRNWWIASFMRRWAQRAALDG